MKYKHYVNSRFVKNIEAKSLSCAAKIAGLANPIFDELSQTATEAGVNTEVSYYDKNDTGVFCTDIAWADIGAKTTRILKSHGLGDDATTLDIDFDELSISDIDHLISDGVVDATDVESFYDSQYWREWRTAQCL